MTIAFKRLGLLIPSLLCAATSVATAESNTAEFPHIKPTPPAEAAGTFQVHPGLRVELVAAEPQIESPVGISFDEDGRLFVVEMRGYPDRQAEKLGRIKLLEDSKGDGHYDKATVYADHLPWPTSVFCYGGGIFVTASPDVIWLKDSKGGSAADERRVVFTGFGSTTNPLNVQGLVNGLTWGFDDRIHGATSFNGGQVFPPDHPQALLDLHGKDFTFDPHTEALQSENGGGQHGLGFDSFGRKFVCMNNQAIETFFYDTRYAGRNPLFALPPSLADVNADGPDVFRISPEESWRVLRTQLRVSGKVTGPIEGGGRASGYFTGVSGIAVYTGDALPAEFRDNAFIGEVANNLVHREVITPDGVSVVAHRAPDEKTTEFLASKDICFRPVQLANGPDGALYVIDMYREVIEHPWSLPDDIRNKLDLHSGMHRGRIWRIVPEGFTPRKPPKLSQASTADLVALLEHPNGWHRDTAARLLYEKQDAAAVPLLEKLLKESKSPVGRLRALCALDGQHALTPSHVIAALHDPDAHVRERGAVLSESFISREGSTDLREALKALSDDPEIKVRYQLAFTIGSAPPAQRTMVLAKIAQRDLGNSWVQGAVLSSASDCEAGIFADLSQSRDMLQNAQGQKFLQQLAFFIGRRGRPDDVARVTKVIGSFDSSELQSAFALARSLREGAAHAKSLPAIEFSALMDDARRTAASPAAPEGVRVEAIRLLGTTQFSEAAPTLTPLLAPDQPQGITLAALAAVDQFDDAQVAPALIKRLATFPPQVRAAALASLVKRPERATALLQAIRSRILAPNSLTSAQADFLRNHSDPTIRSLARNLLVPTGGREPVIQAFQPALSLTGDGGHGRQIYLQRCSPCHHLGGEGFAVGPDLTTVRNDGKPKALVNIIDPNREVAPNYVAYIVETRDGESLIGIVTESADSVTVRQPYGKDTTVLRSNVKRIASQHLSLMPEGLQDGLKPQDFADLLEYIFTAPSHR